MSVLLLSGTSLQARTDFTPGNPMPDCDLFGDGSGEVVDLLEFYRAARDNNAELAIAELNTYAARISQTGNIWEFLPKATISAGFTEGEIRNYVNSDRLNKLNGAGSRFVTAGGYGEQAWDTHDNNVCGKCSSTSRS